MKAGSLPRSRTLKELLFRRACKKEATLGDIEQVRLLECRRTDNENSFCLLASFLLAGSLAQGQMVVHEWGTFTWLQDEAGNSIGGINTDDEPVPDFVHRIAANLLLSPSQAPPHFFQGAPSCHPDITMRLETPVLYFHPQPGWKPVPVDVHVGFRGGWLTEFYPDASFRAPGLDRKNPKQVVSNEPGGTASEGWLSFGHLTPDTVGELSWKGLTIGADGQGPATSEKVWLAPRAVSAAEVKTSGAERENFLFYRGVGHADARLRVVRNDADDTLKIQDNVLDVAMINAGINLRIPAAWLVKVDPDGTCAFRTLGPLGWPIHATAPANFAESDFKAANLSHLRAEMRAALITTGLYPDEADALLNTWQVSYFKSPGLRLFYFCTCLEVDNLLPLQISVPKQIARVMVGRIELVTPQQRALLKRIAAGPAPDLSAMRGVTANGNSEFFKHPENVVNWNAVMAGKAPYSVLGLPIPELYLDYLKLGRFRNALILDEVRRRPTPALEDFITKNGFQAYQVD